MNNKLTLVDKKHSDSFVPFASIHT